jgi:hypothetical protein
MTEGAQDISFRDDGRPSAGAPPKILAQANPISCVTSCHRSSSRCLGSTANTGTHVHDSRPARRAPLVIDAIITACVRKQMAEVPGIRIFMQNPSRSSRSADS